MQLRVITSLALVKRAQHEPIILKKFKIEDVPVDCQSVILFSFDHEGQSARQLPVEDDLGHGLAVFLGQLFETGLV